eukprot:c18073_g1_i2.p1 GENE.c18073_g1_i2~~c18073_g1_i2.p1  ORF type:complete len:622 (+),score=118.64 c18073_g1_i2:239-1867(+)
MLSTAVSFLGSAAANGLEDKRLATIAKVVSVAAGPAEVYSKLEGMLSGLERHLGGVFGDLRECSVEQFQATHYAKGMNADQVQDFIFAGLLNNTSAQADANVGDLTRRIAQMREGLENSIAAELRAVILQTLNGRVFSPLVERSLTAVSQPVRKMLHEATRKSARKVVKEFSEDQSKEALIQKKQAAAATEVRDGRAAKTVGRSADTKSNGETKQMSNASKSMARESQPQTQQHLNTESDHSADEDAEPRGQACEAKIATRKTRADRIGRPEKNPHNPEKTHLRWRDDKGRYKKNLSSSLKQSANKSSPNNNKPSNANSNNAKPSNTNSNNAKPSNTNSNNTKGPSKGNKPKNKFLSEDLTLHVVDTVHNHELSLIDSGKSNPLQENVQLKPLMAKTEVNNLTKGTDFLVQGGVELSTGFRASTVTPWPFPIQTTVEADVGVSAHFVAPTKPANLRDYQLHVNYGVLRKNVSMTAAPQCDESGACVQREVGGPSWKFQMGHKVQENGISETRADFFLFYYSSARFSRDDHPERFKPFEESNK